MAGWRTSTVIVEGPLDQRHVVIELFQLLRELSKVLTGGHDEVNYKWGYPAKGATNHTRTSRTGLAITDRTTSARRLPPPTEI